MKFEKLKQIFRKETAFSGSVLLMDNKKSRMIDEYFGYANRSEKLKNKRTTRYGIASGCKLFTAIAICQLVEKGEISFQSRLVNCLEVRFEKFEKEITVHHLLTHTSGIPDYFDEELMDDFEQLWVERPMYHIRNLRDFLPMFQNQPMKFSVGERFHYNNAGYILLGLIIEQITGMSFTEYIQENIFKPANMEEAGYFSFDSLPARTALGYIDKPDGTWKTNIYSLPIKGGSDGGAFVTVDDMEKLWDALMTFRLLSESYTRKLLSRHVKVDEQDDYGYGVWIKKNDDNSIFKYHVMGYDPGVSFHSAYYPGLAMKLVICSNKSDGAYEMMNEVEKELCDEK